MFTDEEKTNIIEHIAWHTRALEFILKNCCNEGQGLTDEQIEEALGKPPGGPTGG